MCWLLHANEALGLLIKQATVIGKVGLAVLLGIVAGGVVTNPT